MNHDTEANIAAANPGQTTRAPSGEPKIRERVRLVLLDGKWHTGQDLLRRLGLSFGTGLMAKIRDLRKTKYGGYLIEAVRDAAESRATGTQVWRYRMRVDLIKRPDGKPPKSTADPDGQLILGGVAPRGHWQE